MRRHGRQHQLERVRLRGVTSLRLPAAGSAAGDPELLQGLRELRRDVPCRGLRQLSDSHRISDPGAGRSQRVADRVPGRSLWRHHYHRQPPRSHVPRPRLPVHERIRKPDGPDRTWLQHYALQQAVSHHPDLVPRIPHRRLRLQEHQGRHPQHHRLRAAGQRSNHRLSRRERDDHHDWQLGGYRQQCRAQGPRPDYSAPHPYRLHHHPLWR
mmetsp:Transcript_28742/g.65140  ORF Transcript_28742/g.65140 Transcript_28742/m.65140 type:complete len:211 (+) Transcript_28742:1659-2291(+)